MDISSLIAMSLRQPTAKKAAIYIISELFKCTDVDLISLLIEDAAEDKKAVIDGLKAELIGKKPQFDSKMIGIFRQLLNAKTNAEMIEAMKKRPAVASALDYVVKLYAEYASSQEVLDSIAFSPVDGADFFDVKVPELPSKPGRVPPDFAKKLEQAVRTDIEKIALNHLQRPEVQNRYKSSGKWQRGAVADDGEVKAGPEVVTAQDVKQVEDDIPVQSLDASKEIIKSYKNAIESGTGTVANAFADKRFVAAIAALRDSYVKELGEFFSYAVRVGEMPDNVPIFTYGGGSYKLSDLLHEFDPRTHSDLSYWNKQVSLSPLGPYFSLKDYLLPMAQANRVLELDKSKSKIIKGNVQKAVALFIRALGYLSTQVENDLGAVRPEKMNVSGPQKKTFGQRVSDFFDIGDDDD
jgi:hypothetical protein